MSYVNFLGQGAHGLLETYRRDFYSPDTVQSFATTHEYNGKITGITSDSGIKKVDIDNAIKVSTVADKIRDKSQKLWSSMRNGCMGTFTGSLVGGVSAAIAAIAVGVIVPAFWPVAVAVGIFALGLFAFSGWNLARGIEAKDQLKQWNDPIPAYQHQRRLAEQKGFYHAYSSNYKGKIVSEEELEKLWFTSMDNWAEKYSSHLSGLKDVKVQDIRTFMEECPLQSKAIAHTFTGSKTDENELKSLNELSVKYGSLKSQYDTIRMKTESLKSEIRNERSRALLQNDQELKYNLAPYDALISTQKLALLAQQKQYSQIISTHEASLRRLQTQTVHPSRHSPHHVPVGNTYGNTLARRSAETVTVGGHVLPGSGNQLVPYNTVKGHVVPGRGTTIVTTTPSVIEDIAVKNARAELLLINQKLMRLDMIYHAMTAPVRRLHEHNKAKIENWAKGELYKIQKSEDKTLMKFYKPIKALLEAYKHRNDKAVEEEAPIEAKVEDLVDPHAPELRKDFEPLKYDEKWSEFIGEVDWENGIIKHTTIIHEGKKKKSNSESIFSEE